MNRLILPTALAALGLAALPPVAGAGGVDRDRDGMSDRWERRHQAFSPGADPDHDGLRNRQEFRFGMHPRKRDSDGDGVRDGREGAGTITSFSDGVLTIDLLRGGTMKGRVVDATRIECDDDHGDRRGRAAHHGDDDDDSRDEDNSGPGNADDRRDDRGDDDDCGDDPLRAGRKVSHAELEGRNDPRFEEIELLN